MPTYDTLKLVRSKRKKTRPEQHSIEIGRIGGNQYNELNFGI